jgi:hypothetical protein
VYFQHGFLLNVLCVLRIKRDAKSEAVRESLRRLYQFGELRIVFLFGDAKRPLSAEPMSQSAALWMLLSHRSSRSTISADPHGRLAMYGIFPDSGH